MQEIKCPNCGEVFQVDESGYVEILKQVRDAEFDKEIEKRVHELAEKNASDIRIAKMEQEQANKEALLKQENENREAIAKLEEANRKALSKAEEDSRNALSAAEKASRDALQQKDAEIFEMSKQIEKLKADLESSDSRQRVAVLEATKEIEKQISEKANEITELKGQLTVKESENQLQIKSLTEQYEGRLKDKDEQIGYYKDLKTRMSTKLIGETLEQHCEIEFNKLRPTAFRNAYFEKDNDARSGSKGDYIYRETDENGVEIISIMFEMKNEMDTTATKHKNEDFFKELDKDRNEKDCEYAVLVSMLEADNELYNAGIVDVSYRYEKMYVVRPQCFIPIITLLRNAALNSLEYKQELAVVRNQNIDITHFEEALDTFKDNFGKNYMSAHKHFETAIEEIDKTISHLEKVKKELMGSDNQLRIANNKVEDINIKKLTKDAPSVRAMFEELKED